MWDTVSVLSNAPAKAHSCLLCVCVSVSLGQELISRTGKPFYFSPARRRAGSRD
jgi:hypothetical protein